MKGYNRNGDLSVVFDHFENTLLIERDEKNRITAIVDNKNHAIKLNYNNENLLAEIVDVRGRRTTYKYFDDRLIEAEYADGKTIKFGYDNSDNLTNVESSDKIAAELLFHGSRLKEVKYKSLASAISHTGYENGESVVNTCTVRYGENQVAITDNETELVEVYEFNGDGNISYYCKEEHGDVTAATKYTYGAFQYGRFEYRTMQSAKAETLNQCGLDSFTFEAGETETVYYDGVGNATEKVVSGKQISANTFANTTTVYEYDGERRCVKETATTALTGGATDEYTAITTYAYNAAGNVVRKESYIEGEELTSGVTIEETVYDKDGNEVKSFSYNSLDASSKFYKEKVYSEERQVTAEKDETGATSVEYEYIEGTDVVRSEKRANGSTLAYGHDIGDTVTAITQSTAEGEENSTQIAHTLGEVTELKSGNNVVRYEYDGKRRKTAIDLNGAKGYETYSYEEGETEDTATVTNAKGETFTTVSDKKGNVLRKLYNGKEQVSYTYNKDGKVLTETEGEKVCTNEYDTLGNLTGFARGEYAETIAYDNYGQIKSCHKNGREYVYKYKSNAARDLESVNVEGITITPEKDILGRNKGKEISANGSKLAGEYLYYRKVGDHATNMPSAIYFGQKQGEDFAIRDNVKYEYDKSGNICKIYENGALAVRYEYDSLDRLVREDNKKLGFTTLFAYDNCGNIISKRQTAFTLKTNVEECEFEETLYAYDGDRLLYFGTEKCEYDEVGNPTLYRGKAAMWEKGRQLKSYNGVEFNYDGNGRRIGKNNVTFTYDSDGKLIASSNGLEFLYDNAGVFGIKYNGETYFYRKDAQGNILALLDGTGKVVVKYVYDAWGNHAVLDGNGNDISDENHIGNLNPFRYKGYFYDTETELYYLQTRYYDPEIGRFITIDSVDYLDPESINGLNLYAYCGNNPVMFTDPNGTAKWWEWLLGILIIVAVVALSVVTAGLAAPIAAVAGGGLTGAIIGGAVAGAVGGAIAGFGISVATQGISKGFSNIDWKQVGIDTLVGGITGAISGGVFGGIKFTTGAGRIAGSATKIGNAGSKFYDAVDKSKFLTKVVKGGLTGTNYIQNCYYLIKTFVDMTYKAEQFLLKNLLGNLYKQSTR